MLGVTVNSVAVIIGTLLGLMLKKGINKKLSDAVMVGVGLSVTFIAVGGLILENDVEAVSLASIVAIVIGAVVGTVIDIDKWLTKLGDTVSKRIKSKPDSGTSVSEGFVNATLLFCVGAMAIMGSISAGLQGNNTTLYIKSVLDFISSIMFASAFGIGVIFSSIPLFIYQGAIALSASFIAPYLSAGATEAITCSGSIILVGLSFNLIGITKIKVANYLPAIFLSPFLFYLFDWVLSFVR
ncbi:MAG: DUF554 domain-containing protein [Clostridia bacterium]|nr:DUF554 domain-containing protein [Clostridia bacterium]